MAKPKAWKATVRGKRDVLVVRIAYLLREVDRFERRAVTKRAFAFNDDVVPQWP